MFIIVLKFRPPFHLLAIWLLTWYNIWFTFSSLFADIFIKLYLTLSLNSNQLLLICFTDYQYDSTLSRLPQFIQNNHSRKCWIMFCSLLDLKYDNMKQPRNDIDTYSMPSLKRKKVSKEMYWKTFICCNRILLHFNSLWQVLYQIWFSW